MIIDADTLNDMKVTLSIIESIVSSSYKELSESKRRRVKEILEHPRRYYLEGDELLIHASSPLLEGNKDSDIPFENIQTLDLIGDASKGFYNAVYLEKKARFLFPNAKRYRSSSSAIFLPQFKEALKDALRRENFDYGTLWFGFAYEGDLYTLEYVGENGLDVYLASHPFGNRSLSPLPLALANMEPMMVERRYIETLTLSGESIPLLSSFRKSLYESGVESLLEAAKNLKEIVIGESCPNKEEIIETARKRGIKIVG